MSFEKKSIEEDLTVEWLDGFALRIENTEGELFYLTPETLKNLNNYYADIVIDKLKEDKDVST